MKKVLLLGAICLGWMFMDLESDNVMFCVVAPLFLSVSVFLAIAILINDFGSYFGSDTGPNNELDD